MKADQSTFYSLQDILMEIANNFINVSLEKTDEVINKSLAMLGEFTQTDRAYVFNYDHFHKLSSNTYEWCRDGIAPQITELQNIPYEAIGDWTAMHFSGKSMVIPNVMDLDPESTVRQILEPQDIKSLIALPMMDGTVCTGFVGFDSVFTFHEYSEKEQKLLELFALMLVNLNNRKETQTRLNQAIAEAREASKAKSEFLANMSHEIRTPLNGVIGFTDLLKSTPLNDTQKKYVENANLSGHTLLAIINDILDFSKIEAGMMEFESIKTDLLGLIDEVTGLAALGAQKKGLAMVKNLDRHLPQFVFTDPLRLKQIITNLLSNAVKFTESGEIDFSVKINPVSVDEAIFRFSVSDTGIGISEEQKSRLFKAFSQADNSTTRKYGGTGLGLIISDKIARNMGSRIEFDTHPQGGSVFYFDIKLKAADYRFEPDFTGENVSQQLQSLAELNNTEALVDSHEHPDPSRKKILVAEDVELNMLMLKSQLELIVPQAQLLEASNGREAIRQYQQSAPDLVIMDLHMPEMDGLEATQKIRKIEKESGAASIPIIALTADAFSQQQENCLKAGMNEFMTKPLDAEKLKQILLVYFE
jgi:signal transduction histidine kinase/CheY-like chemotaxis protein